MPNPQFFDVGHSGIRGRKKGLSRGWPLLLVTVILSACDKSPPPIKVEAEEPFLSALKNVAVDPTSVIVSKDIRSAGEGICGKVNLKNRKGAYIGWTGFIFEPKQNAIYLDALSNPAVEDAYDKIDVPSNGLMVLFQRNCEGANQKRARIARETQETADKEAKQLAEQVAQLHKWLAGKWLRADGPMNCNLDVTIYQSDGTFYSSKERGTFKISPTKITQHIVSDTYTAIDEESRAKLHKPFTFKYVKLSDDEMITYVEGSAIKLKRCPS